MPGRQTGASSGAAVAITFTVDWSQITGLETFAARVMGQFDWITSIAMTKATKAAHAALKDQVLPQIEGGPAPWTLRGLIWIGARPDNLVSKVGWNFGEASRNLDGSLRIGGNTDALTDLGADTMKGMGVPSGRYMSVQAGGGERPAKSTELALWRQALLPEGRYIVPNLEVIPRGMQDRYGNVKGPYYMQMLTRLGVEYQGSISKVRGAGSRGRSNAKLAATDFVLMGGIGRDAKYIAIRSGPGPQGGTGIGTGKRGRPQTVGYQRGIRPAFQITRRPPRYQGRYDIQGIAERAFNAAFPVEWSKLLDKEFERRNG